MGEESMLVSYDERISDERPKNQTEVKIGPDISGSVTVETKGLSAATVEDCVWFTDLDSESLKELHQKMFGDPPGHFSVLIGKESLGITESVARKVHQYTLNLAKEGRDGSGLIRQVNVYASLISEQAKRLI